MEELIQQLLHIYFHTEITKYKVIHNTFDQESKDLQRTKSLLQDSIGVELVEVFVPRDEKIIKERFMESINVIEYPSTVQMEVGILQSFITLKRW